MAKNLSVASDMGYNFEEINHRIKIAIEILFKNDIFLLKNDVNERSISHKLAEYLQQQFPGWNVDCEYNRKKIDIKKLEGISECSEEKSTDIVIPDIIIHQRNKNTKNLLVLEIKTNNDNPNCDIKKLEFFTSEKGEYKYNFGLFLKFNKSDDPELIWYKNGKIF
jgi:hypothetical protein